MIILLCSYMPNHNQNLLSLAPENYSNNNINLLSTESCDRINQEEIFEAIDKIV